MEDVKVSGSVELRSKLEEQIRTAQDYTEIENGRIPEPAALKYSLHESFSPEEGNYIILFLSYGSRSTGLGYKALEREKVEAYLREKGIARDDNELNDSGLRAK